MNLAAFAVIVARERETGLGDDIARGRRASALTRPLLAWPMTIAMLVAGRHARRRRASSASSR